MKRRPYRKWIILTVVVVIVGAAVAAFTQMSAGPPTVDDSSLAGVERGDLARSVVATGIVEPISNRIEIRSKASGIVKKIYVDVGDRVKSGQVLVELDRDQLLAQLREVEANLQAAKADVLAAKAELEKNTILAEEYDVELAKVNHLRIAELYKQKLVSKAEFDATRGRLEEAMNRQRAATASIAVTEASIIQKEARVGQVLAAVDRTKEELRFATVQSPIDGLVLSRKVEVGSAVSSILTMGAGATTILTIGDMSDVYVKGEVNETDIGVVAVGLPVGITVEAYKDKVFSGSVYKISPLGEEEDSVTSFEVRVTVENSEGLLLANMSANAEIILEEHKQTLVVPEGAIVYDENKDTFVEVPDPTNEAGRRRVQVETDISTGTKIEVLSGLSEGDRVIIQ